jgi:hypothetical protein
VNRLVKLRDQIVMVDTLDRLMDEYQPYVNFRGEPGVGDAFYRYVFDNQYYEDRVRRVEITPSADEGRGYEELPENTMRAGDRVVLAVAVTGKGRVVNATDSDWAEQEELMTALNVGVVQVCPALATKLK